MSIRAAAVVCLVFSGLSALVYQVLWTRMLGFVFGSSTEAIGTVLAVFFGGMALGNWWAARRLDRVRHPLRLYGWLEAFVGLCGLASLPLLGNLALVHSWVGVDHGPTATAAIRLLAAACVLLPPTVAMGATLPVVARALVSRDEVVGRWSAYLYGANTGGAVLGAYLCGFWLIPGLGLTRTVLLASAINLAVAVGVIVAARAARPSPDVTVGAVGAVDAAGDGAEARHPAAAAATAAPDDARLFLVLFGLSGFVAIGYEIVWSKVFTIVMEGTLFGFSTVLSAYLFGLAVGSLAIAGRVDRIRDPRRAFAWLHVGAAVSVALGMMIVGDLPYWHRRIGASATSDVHGLYLLAAPLMLLPTACFGAAFPVLIRLYSPSWREAGGGIGRATAVNTAGSIAASLFLSFWSIDTLGLDATLYGLVLLELGIGASLLLRGVTAEGARRWRTAAPAWALFVVVALGFNGVRIERAVAGRSISVDSLSDYRAELERHGRSRALLIEGRSSVVTVHEDETGWVIRNNGLPESNYRNAAPHRSLETVLLAALPYLVAEAAERALVVGFGGGASVDALQATAVRSIQVVELEPGILGAIPTLYRGRPSPADDPRVRLEVADGRHELLRARSRGSRGWDVISSQPSHPWLLGSANLFTEEYFGLARDGLAPGGAFAAWVNGFHTDPDSVLAIVNGFERVFPGSLVWSTSAAGGRASLLLLGGHEPLELDVARLARRMTEPGLAAVLAAHGIRRVEDLLARLEGPAAVFTALRPELRNTDDNAFVETRLSRIASWERLDFAAIESALPEAAPVLPPMRGEVDVRAIAEAALPGDRADGIPGYAARLQRLLAAHGDALAPYDRQRLALEVAAMQSPSDEAALRALEALSAAHPDRPEAPRAVGRHIRARRGEPARAARSFEEAWRRGGAAADAVMAARAWRVVDRERALSWLARVPESERRRVPELVMLEAERDLALGADPETLARHRATLLALARDPALARGGPDVRRVLMRLDQALGRGPVRARRPDGPSGPG